MIARDGVLPGSQLQELGIPRQWSGYQRSRDGYVYLGYESYVSECVDTVEPIFRIDLTQLDAARLACDEDHVSIYTTADRHEDHVHALAELLPESFQLAKVPHRWTKGQKQDVVRWKRTGPLGRPLVHGEFRRYNKSQGDWASLPKNAAALARPEFVRASIHYGSVAHEGPISPELLTFNLAWFDRMVADQRRSRFRGHVEMKSLEGIACAVSLVAPELANHVVESMIGAYDLEPVAASTLLRHWTDPAAAREQIDKAAQELVAA
jgi:hypothetical protein